MAAGSRSPVHRERRPLDRLRRRALHHRQGLLESGEGREASNGIYQTSARHQGLAELRVCRRLQTGAVSPLQDNKGWQTWRCLGGCKQEIFDPCQRTPTKIAVRPQNMSSADKATGLLVQLLMTLRASVMPCFCNVDICNVVIQFASQDKYSTRN